MQGTTLSATRQEPEHALARPRIGAASDSYSAAMADIKNGRWTAEIEGDFVVFIIGARLNSSSARAVAHRPRRPPRHEPHAQVPHRAPGEGSARLRDAGFKTIVQYWRSFEHLEAFAKDTDDPHLEVWRNYWKRVGKSGRTGIWHETFLVRAGEYEAIYGNMPAYGLGKASKARTGGRIRWCTQPPQGISELTA